MTIYEYRSHIVKVTRTTFFRRGHYPVTNWAVTCDCGLDYGGLATLSYADHLAEVHRKNVRP